MKDIIECIVSRRSVRQYLDKQIKDTELNLMIEAAQYAPSGMGTQERHFAVVQNKNKLQELNALAKKAFHLSQSPSLKQMASNDSFSFFYHAPTLIIVSAGPNSLTPTQDCAVALENMFLAAKAQGIASCWINTLGDLQKEPTIRTLLTSFGVPTDYTVYGSGAFGYPAAEWPLPAPRREGIVTITK